MTPCGYCGKPIAPERSHCGECGTARPPDAPRAAPRARAPVLELGRIEGAFIELDGFSRPDWPRIAAAIERLESSDHPAAWQDAAVQWADQLRRDLGGAYAVLYSPGTVLLSDLPEDAAARMVHFADMTAACVEEHLGGLAWRDQPGPRILLLLSEADDYYSYVGGFYAGDSIPESLGVYLGGGYPHVAIWRRSEVEAAQVLIHELVHNCLGHLPLPLWLNEGVAMTLERAIAGTPATQASDGEQSNFWAMVTQWKPPLMWEELAEAHRAHWNADTIQAFWAGVSFEGPAQELSYSLASVLVHLLGENHEDFLQFLSQASCEDAGQTAALDCLGISLGDAAATFLGEGQWRPVRAHMVKCWNPPTPADAGGAAVTPPTPPTAGSPPTAPQPP